MLRLSESVPYSFRQKTVSGVAGSEIEPSLSLSDLDFPSTVSVFPPSPESERKRVCYRQMEKRISLWLRVSEIPFSISWSWLLSPLFQLQRADDDDDFIVCLYTLKYLLLLTTDTTYTSITVAQQVAQVKVSLWSTKAQNDLRTDSTSSRGSATFRTRSTSILFSNTPVDYYSICPPLK